MKVRLQARDGHVCIQEALKNINLDYEGKVIRFYDFQRNTYTQVQPEFKIPLALISTNNCDLMLIKIGATLKSITSQSGSASQDP